MQSHMAILIAYRPSNIVEFCSFCWKIAKNAPFDIKSPVKNFHNRAKGGPSHRGRPLKYATGKDVTYSNYYLFLILKKNWMVSV